MQRKEEYRWSLSGRLNDLDLYMLIKTTDACSHRVDAYIVVYILYRRPAGDISHNSLD